MSKSRGPFQVGFRNDLEIVIHEAISSTYEYRPFWAVTKIDMPTDIFNALLQADLVIADLRGLNPNVMYELGIRHAFNKPVLHLVDRNTELPWDVDKNYTVRYDAPIQVSKKNDLIKEIRDRIEKVNSIRGERDGSFNSFHAVTKTAQVLQNFSGNSDVKVVLEKIYKDMNSGLSAVGNRIDSISREVREIQAHSSHPSLYQPFAGYSYQPPNILSAEYAYKVGLVNPLASASIEDPLTAFTVDPEKKKT